LNAKTITASLARAKFNPRASDPVLKILCDVADPKYYLRRMREEIAEIEMTIGCPGLESTVKNKLTSIMRLAALTDQYVEDV
jgi:hypothetical protein